jgi:hypothetical protein
MQMNCCKRIYNFKNHDGRISLFKISQSRDYNAQEVGKNFNGGSLLNFNAEILQSFVETVYMEMVSMSRKELLLVSAAVGWSSCRSNAFGSTISI